MDSLAGRLLVATPSIHGEFFSRSVVLLLHHDGDGAHGLVLNKPLTVGVDSVLPTWSNYLSSPERLFQGGPVGMDTALGLVRIPDRDEGFIGIHTLFPELAVVDLDAPPEILLPGLRGVRIFAGYSGWSGGQLEGEMAQQGWYVVPGRTDDVFTPHPEKLWEQVLRRQPGRLSLVSLYPSDPALN